MIKRLGAITLITYVFFVLEMLLNNSLGVWAKPELLLLSVVFWGLYSSIRDSIFAGVISGLLKDTFSILPFGTYLLVFIAAAYLTTIIRQNLYQPGSRFSRAVVTFFVLLGVFIIEMILYLMHSNVHARDLLINILLPQVVTTMVAVTYVFHRLRDLASWLKL